MVSPGRGGQLLIGTTGNCVLTAEWEAEPQPIVRGHTDEVWAAAAHPGRPQFATGGWDGRLFMWDLVTHAPVWTIDFEVSWTGGVMVVMLCFVSVVWFRGMRE